MIAGVSWLLLYRKFFIVLLVSLGVLRLYNPRKNARAEQIAAFKGLIALSTRYPYVGRLLAACIRSKATSAESWGEYNPNRSHDPTWNHFNAFAMACLSEQDDAAALWESLPDEWGRASLSGNTIIGQLVRTIKRRYDLNTRSSAL